MIKKVKVPTKGYGTVQRDVMTMDITIYAKSVYCLLCTYTGGKSSCYPSLNTITADLKISKFSVLKAISELENSNLLFVKRRHRPDKENMVNEYIPCLIYEEIEVEEKDERGSACDEPPSACDEPGVVREANRKKNSFKNNIKERKVKEKFTPPELKEVLEYFKENGYSEESATRAFNYYVEGKWHDGRGNKVKNWKQKMRGVWFKPENLSTTSVPANAPLSNSEKRRMGILN